MNCQLENFHLNTEILGTSFHKLLATDADSSYNSYNVIRFYKVVDSERPSGNRFEVLEDGTIKLIGDLDREKDPQITFKVFAKDMEGSPSKFIQKTN